MSEVDDSSSTGSPSASNDTSVDELKTLIEQLQQQYNESATELAAIKAKTPMPTNTVSRIIVPRERKIKRFSGLTSENAQSVKDFVEEIQSVFQAREMPPHESLDFIISHLDSPAREEVKLYPLTERNSCNENHRHFTGGFWREAFATTVFESIL